MKRKILIATIVLVVVLGIIVGVKALQIGTMMGMKKPVLTETVTAAVVEQQSWEVTLSSVGSLAAVQGVMLSAEISGKITHIAFEPGTMADKGSLLVQQDVAAETAQLRSAEASLVLAETNFRRAAKLLQQKTNSRSEYDNANAQYQQALAQVENIKAVVAKKTIRAPFHGELGIRLINLGQFLNAGDAIVSLQSLDSLFVNFSLPQKQLAQIRTGMTLRVKTDALPDSEVEGVITAINPQVDAATRNIAVQATVENSRKLLRPGMFVTVSVVLPEQQQLLAIPATAVLNAPYSDSVFIVEDAPEKGAAQGKVVRQQFVKLGRRQGDFVAVTAGLKPGETVVSTGAFKLRNGKAVVVDNTLAPAFKLDPKPDDR